MTNLFRSARLIYRAIEDNDQDNAFFHTLLRTPKASETSILPSIDQYPKVLFSLRCAPARKATRSHDLPPNSPLFDFPRRERRGDGEFETNPIHCVREDRGEDGAASKQ